MVKNYIFVAWRNLSKHRFYSGLNILGLTIGLTSFLLISLFVMHEVSYDEFYENADRIYRVDFTATLNGTDHIAAQVGAPTGDVIKNDYPEVEDATRLSNSGNWFIKRKDALETFKEEEVLMADSNFFEFFSVKLIHGEPNSILNKRNTLALDETTSKKIFGDKNPIGEVLVLDNKTDYEVTAVFADLPEHSHFKPNVLLSIMSFDWAMNGQWLSTNFNTYIRLNEGASAQQLEAKFPSMTESYCGPLIQKFLNMTMDEFHESGNALGFSLFPMSDIHLYSSKEGELRTNGDIKYIYIFSAVAIFILILACINFMNLATARSANRAKEVGVRKAMGAFKKQLIYQFMTEALMISVISFILAFAAAFMVLPFFNILSGKSLDYSLLFEPQYFLPMLSLAFLVGLLAGSYPSFYLSSFKPVEVLKGKIKTGMKSGLLRSSLVVFQFSISIIMIIGTAIVFDQLSYIQNKKIGYNKDQVIVVEDTWLLRDQAKAFKNESSRHGSIVSNTLSGFTPTRGNNNSDLYFKNANAASDESLVISKAFIDTDFLNTLDIEIVKGRGFSKEFGNDSLSVIINESAVKQFGYKEALNGKIFTYWGDQDDPTPTEFKIIGIVKDFHFESLKNGISPLIMHFSKTVNSRALFKFEAENTEETIAHIRNSWEQFAPGQPFSFSFLDDQFQSLYENEQRIGDLFVVFAVLSILIACLGLYGLASFTAEQRTKEIGIRKVLGASISSIMGLLSKEFIKLVIISFIIAAPIAYYFMNEWLTDFEYRTDLKPVTFILSGVVALIIAWSTMGSQSYRAAKSSPSRSLRNE